MTGAGFQIRVCRQRCATADFFPPLKEIFFIYFSEGLKADLASVKGLLAYIKTVSTFGALYYSYCIKERKMLIECLLNDHQYTK